MLPIRDSIPSRRPALVLYGLVIVNILVFCFQLTLPEAKLDEFFYLFGIVPRRYSHPSWAREIGFPDNYWPFLTSMFLHGGWMHIIGNMWTLWIFGDNVEDRMGPIRFLVFYMLCGLAAGIVHWLTNYSSTIPTVGASGAIAGVLGAYFLLFPRSWIVVMVPIIIYPVFFDMPAIIYLGIWFATQFFSGVGSLASSSEVGGVAWWAHIGGFVMGLVLTPFFARRADDPHPWQPDEYGIESAWMRSRYPGRSREVPRWR
jgi:membrane associated rhomboid family serine protease